MDCPENGAFPAILQAAGGKARRPAHLSVTGAASRPVLALFNYSRKGRFAMSSLTSWSPHVLSLLRLASGAAFMAHGTQKWLSFPPRSFAQPELFSMTGAGGAIEFIGRSEGRRGGKNVVRQCRYWW